MRLGYEEVHVSAFVARLPATLHAKKDITRCEVVRMLILTSLTIYMIYYQAAN